MTKYEALVNAQGVFAWAVLFGHGSLFDLTDYGSSIVLSVHFPYSQFDHDREDDKYKSVVMAGAHFKWYNRPDLKIEVFEISWHYSK